MITVDDLSLQYSGAPLFSKVNLQFTPGNCYGIIGANGAGKSTFLRILTGELDSTNGSVTIDPTKRVSVLKQNQNAYDDYTVMDTVIMGNQRLYDCGKEKDAIYAKDEMTDEDGIRASELEEEFADLGGWEAESDASRILQGLGVGFTYTGSTYCATGWYPDKRGFASGLCMAFNGGSATFLAPLIVKLIGSIGIIVTLYIVGGAIIVIGICAAIGLKSAPVGYAPAGWKAKADDPKLAATQLESLTPGQAFRTRGYWHLFLGYGLFPTMYIICYPRFSVLISDAGYSLNAATIGVSIYSICNVIGRFGMGALIDKLGYRKVYTICGICSVASSLCLMFANSLAMFYIAYVLLAVGFGATNCCHPVAVQETYGSKYAGGIFGICMLGYMIICTFISPKISSALVKATGSYTASMVYAIIACIIAVIFYTTIPQPKRRTLAEVAAEEKAAQEKAAQA